MLSQKSMVKNCFSGGVVDVGDTKCDVNTAGIDKYSDNGLRNILFGNCNYYYYYNVFKIS